MINPFVKVKKNFNRYVIKHTASTAKTNNNKNKKKTIKTITKVDDNRCNKNKVSLLLHKNT